MEPGIFQLLYCKSKSKVLLFIKSIGPLPAILALALEVAVLGIPAQAGTRSTLEEASLAGRAALPEPAAI